MKGFNLSVVLAASVAFLSIPAAQAEIVTTEVTGHAENIILSENMALQRAHGDLNNQCRERVRAKGENTSTFSYRVKKHGKTGKGYFTTVQARCECL